MAPTTDTGWYDQHTGEPCADPFGDQPSAILDGPTIATVNLLAHLRGITYGQALIESVQQWKTALADSIEREAFNARYWLDPLTRDVTALDAEDACLTEAQASMNRIATLRGRIAHADHLLAGAEDQHYR
ncbi:hypothetical protein GTV32_22810 [Gordonia sp. SID5947]|uniref:hypothetical protein n=1 Tax=Gordonia sp. SID5947 TaxID=2690315 RepID=UPI00136AD766|nr:hypothetical protein [Gordonia sp. SID5947]MYR08967.1 hypothetical protein [Gordonia sp. SID5947]